MMNRERERQRQGQGEREGGGGGAGEKSPCEIGRDRFVSVFVLNVYCGIVVLFFVFLCSGGGGLLPLTYVYFSILNNHE